MYAAVDWGRGIEDAWTSIVAFVPKLIAFAVILVIGYFVVKMIAAIVDKALQRVGFDKAVERGGIGRMLAQSDYDASDLLSKVVFWALFLFVLQLAFGVFGANPVSDLITGIVAYLPKVIAALLIIVITAALAAFAKDMISSTMGTLSYGRTLANGVAGAILTFGVFAALNQLEIAPEIVNALFIAVLATVAGATIIAVGGGGIVPMRQRWEGALQRYEQEKPRLQEQLRVAREEREREKQQLIDLSDSAEAQRRAEDEQQRIQAAEFRAGQAEVQAQRAQQQRAARSPSVGARGRTRNVGPQGDRPAPPTTDDPNADTATDPSARPTTPGGYRQPSQPTYPPPGYEPPPTYDPRQAPYEPPPDGW